jgi:glucan biosynthesis protein C
MNRILLEKASSGNPARPVVLKVTARSGRKDQKNKNVETLRGLAIILVVFGHMIGVGKTGGMTVSDDSIFRYMYYTLEYIRMPLFTVISGWVYANKPILDADRGKFVKGKLRRLILPMFVLSTLLFVFRMVIPGTHTSPVVSDLPKNIFFPYDVFWYLYSLFLIFLVITVVDKKPFFHTVQGWLTTLVCGFIFLTFTKVFLEPVPNFFSFKGTAYLFPFFLIGIGINRYKELLLNDKLTFVTFFVFIAGITIQQMAWFGYFPQQEKQSLLGMIVGITAVLLLFKLQLRNTLLVWIGGYAYAIFLFHVFFTGGSRIALLKAGVSNQWIILIIGVLCALGFSILAAMVISRVKILRLCFLGLKRNEKRNFEAPAGTLSDH